MEIGLAVRCFRAANRDDVCSLLSGQARETNKSVGRRGKAWGGVRRLCSGWEVGLAVPHKPPPPNPPPHLYPHFLPPQVKNYRVTRQRMQLPDDGTRGEATLEYASGLQGLTPRQLDVFIQQIIAKYEVKRIHPGGEGGKRNRDDWGW